MDASANSPMQQQQAPRRGHLKRLSLSVGAGSPSSSTASPMSTPDKHQYAPTSSSLLSSSAGSTASPRDSLSPLRRSLGSSSTGRRRQRPMSMHAGMSSPLSTSLASLDATLASPAASVIDSSMQRDSDHLDEEQNITSKDSVAHPLSATPTHDETTIASPGSSIASPSPSSTGLRNSAGRRSILGRSAHARRQSSISYARSPSYDSPTGTPRTSLTAIRDEEEEEEKTAPATARPSPSPMPVAQTPSRTSLDRQSLDSSSTNEAAGQSSFLSGTSPSSVNEMNIGPGARSSDLLTFIAKKERKCLDLREELQRHENELAALKKKWEMVIQREMAASTSPSSSNMSPSHSTGSASGAASLFSSLTSTLHGSSSTSLSSSTSSQTAPGDGVASPSPKPSASSSRRLLTNRHSISVTSPSTGVPYFGGGADLSPQTSPLSALNGSQPVASLDVQKIAKSWLGGVMKSASTVLEGLAPPPPSSSQNDLQTVTEEEEPEDGEEDDTQRYSAAHQQQQRQRSSVGHPNRDQSPHNRKESTATNTTFASELSSPSSSCEDGRFSSSTTSRSSSVSSLHSDNQQHKEGDATPIATPVLPYGNNSSQTPKAGDEERDLWASSGGDFEDDSARERRENMERNRIDIAKGSPRKEMRSPSSQTIEETGFTSPKPVRPSAHGRRRSTAFELGGAWGAIVGKKWNEMASTISSNETLRNSSKKALGLMEGFEKSLNDAITPDAHDQQQRDEYYHNGTNTQLMLVNGELIPTGDWSPPSQSRPLSKERRDNSNEKSLPSGIGGPSAWSALLGRTPSRTTPKSPQSEFAWQGENHQAVSPSLSTGSNSRMSRSLLDEENDDYESTRQDPLNASNLDKKVIPNRTASLSPTPLTAQERIQASRAKHAKRMSMPVNSMKSPSPVEEKKATAGLGLLDENEEEDEGSWGW